MAVKPNQLKKFKVKELKNIIKKHKLGKVSKKRKAQLVAMIMSAENVKDILSNLTMPLKKNRKFSVKQLAAQQAFKNRRNKGSMGLGGGKVQRGSALDNTIQKVLKVFGAERKFKEPIKPKIPMNTNIDIEDIVDEIDTPVPIHQVEKLVNAAEEVAEVIEANPTKTFLDSIFGFQEFDFEEEIIDIVNALEDDEKLNKFLSLPKKEIKSLLMRKYNNALSINQFIKSI